MPGVWTLKADAMNTMKALLCMLLLACAAPATAAIAVPASVEDLARSSDAVVRGRVSKVSSQWSSDHRRIFTQAEVETSSVWRGSAPTRVTVVVPGGVVGDIGQRVDGSPTFSQGEEVALFLERAGEGKFGVRGLGQGKFSIAAGQAQPQLGGFTFAPGPALRAGERRTEPMGVAELEQRVRAAR